MAEPDNEAEETLIALFELVEMGMVEAVVEPDGEIRFYPTEVEPAGVVA